MVFRKIAEWLSGTKKTDQPHPLDGPIRAAEEKTFGPYKADLSTPAPAPITEVKPVEPVVAVPVAEVKPVESVVAPAPEVKAEEKPAKKPAAKKPKAEKPKVEKPAAKKAPAKKPAAVKKAPAKKPAVKKKADAVVQSPARKKVK